MIVFHSRFSLLLALAAACAVHSCAQAQNEPDDEAAAPKKPAGKVVKRAQPKTLYVKAGVPQGGDGSSAKPFAGLQAAIDAAQGGDTVVVAAGTYDGGIEINASYPGDAPLTVRAAEGAQPVISGMRVVRGWKPGLNGLYTAEIEGRAKDLFSGAARLTIASWPKVDQSWIGVGSVDTTGNKVLFTGSAPPPLAKDTKLYTFSKTKATYEFRNVQGLSMEGTNGAVALDAKTAADAKADKITRFTFFNSPSFISQPDEYAVEYPDATHTRFHFRPKNVAELENTQYRAGGSGISVRGANVRVSGFIVTGMTGSGINARGARNVTVENCVLYNNDTGFGSRDVSDLTLRRCVSMQNYWGISLSDAQRINVEECEVAFNDEDGVRISGRIFDTKSNKIGSSDIQFNRCYVHHHQYQGHPDNIQFFRGVGQVRFSKMLLMFGGQQMMMEQTADMKITDSVVLSSINRSMNLFAYKQPETKGWTLENNTVGYSRYNPAYAGGQNTVSTANVFFQFQQPVTYPADGLQANYDWFSPRQSKGGVDSLSVKSVGNIGTKTDLGAKGGLEANGNIGEARMRNVPASMNVAFGSGGSTPERLTFDIDTKASYEVGDLIEINGDGVARKITQVEPDAIRFTPALPASPFRYSCVFNWKNNANFQIDTRPAANSPLLTGGPGGKAAGSSVDVAAYQKGDFDGDGQRDLPVLPAELAAMLGERPNRYIYPYSM